MVGHSARLVVNDPDLGVRVDSRSRDAQVVIAHRLETDRLVLQPLQISDAGEMVAVLADESLYEFEGGEPPTLDSLQARYRHQVGGSTDPGEIWLNWIIRRQDDDRAVGFVQADVVGEAADLGWLVGVADQRCGIATESVRAVIDWLALEGIRRLGAHIHPGHIASQTVAQRIGLAKTEAVDSDGEFIWAADARLN